MRLYPGVPPWHLNLGNALLRKGDIDGAIGEYLEILRMNPDEPAGHNNLARALHQRGDLDGAAREFRELTRLTPDDPDAHNNLGAVLKLQGDLDSAIAEFPRGCAAGSQRASTHTRTWPTRWLVRATSMHSSAKMREIARLDPSDPGPHITIGYSLRDNRDTDGAIAEFREGYTPQFSMRMRIPNLAPHWREWASWTMGMRRSFARHCGSILRMTRRRSIW